MATYYTGETVTLSILDITHCTYQISRDNGSTWITLAAGVEAVITNEGEDNEVITNSYEWTVNGPSAAQCKIKYIDDDDSEEYEDDTTFEILRALPTVTFGGEAATVVSSDEEKTVVITPAHAAGAVDVVLTNSDGESVTSTGGFTYVAAAGSNNSRPRIGIMITA